METSAEFTAQLADALAERQEYLEKTTFTKLKENFRIFYLSYQAIYNVLLRKGLIHEDPYKHDQKISEISNPPEGPFLESEKSDQISIRMSSYDSQLDFLNNYYQFSFEFLTLDRIKRLVKLLKYFKWDNLTESSPNLNTRYLAEFMGRLKTGADPVSTGILSESADNCKKYSKEILSLLKSVTDYHRETYKLEIREKVIPNIDINESTALSQRIEVTQQIKKRIAIDMAGKPCYTELVEEVFNENYSFEAQELRGKLISKLKVKKEVKTERKTELEFKSILLDAIRTMSSSSRPLDEAVRKLKDNAVLLEIKKQSFFEKLKEWIVRMTNGSDKKKLFEIEFFDIVTSTTKQEKLDFESFTEDVQKKSRLYAGFIAKMSSAYKRLESAEEDQLFQFLTTNLESLTIFQRRLQALDTFFKSEVPREQRAKIQGIKTELTSLKNNMIKANQKKHEYVSKHEELEQMKRLGIKVS